MFDMLRFSVGCAVVTVTLTVLPAKAAQTCDNDAECSDGTGATLDWCHDGQCHNIDLDQAACKDDSTPCRRDNDCSNGDASQISWCFDRRCHYAARDGTACSEAGQVRCRQDAECSDDNAETIDWCHEGTCMAWDQSDATCRNDAAACTKRTDCDNGDPDTIDWCFREQCHHAPRDTGICETDWSPELVDYEYFGNCGEPAVAPSLWGDGVTMEVPFEGTGFEAVANSETGTPHAHAECYVLITLSIPPNKQIAPDFVDFAGVADLSTDTIAGGFSEYRLIGGGKSPVATQSFAGPYTGGLRIQSHRLGPHGRRDSDWSTCGQKLATFRLATGLTATLGNSSTFAELSMSNSVNSQVLCGYAVRDCRLRPR